MNELIEGTYVKAAGARNYKLYVTERRNGEAPPMFVMLHGCDQDATGFAAGTRMNELADECHGIVLYPEQCRMVNPLGCWNWYDTEHQSVAHGEPSLIAGMTVQVMAERGIDPARVYIAGLSAGGAMALILGQEYPDLYAAVGVHSGVPSGVATDLLSALRIMSDGPLRGNVKRHESAQAQIAPCPHNCLSWRCGQDCASVPRLGHSLSVAAAQTPRTEVSVADDPRVNEDPDARTAGCPRGHAYESFEEWRIRSRIVGGARWWTCVGRWQPGGDLHRQRGSGCLPRNGAVLPSAATRTIVPK